MRSLAYLRLTAILINGLFVLTLLGWKAWLMPIGGLGLPVIVPPALALVALALSHRERGGVTRTLADISTDPATAREVQVVLRDARGVANDLLVF